MQILALTTAAGEVDRGVSEGHRDRSLVPGENVGLRVHDETSSESSSRTPRRLEPPTQPRGPEPGLASANTAIVALGGDHRTLRLYHSPIREGLQRPSVGPRQPEALATGRTSSAPPHRAAAPMASRLRYTVP